MDLPNRPPPVNGIFTVNSPHNKTIKPISSTFVKQNRKENWDGQVNKWKEDFEKAQQENQENWDNIGKKMQQDYLTWENKVREDWKDGVKEFNRASARAYVRFLLYTIPIIIILVVIFSVIGPYLPTP